MNLKIVELVKEGSCTFASFDGKSYYEASGIGVKPIITPMRENMGFFKGREVADTIIGKAAAMLLVLSGARAVYGKVMSKSAVEVLTAHGIEFSYGTLVEYIENRSGDGMCPLEDSVKDEEDIHKAFIKIEKRIEELMKKAHS